MSDQVIDEKTEKIMLAIKNALESYRCEYTEDAEFGDGLVLVDALTPPGQSTIELGRKELDSLIDSIQGAVYDILKEKKK